MTFDLTPEQQLLIATARMIAALPKLAMDAVLVVEERASVDPAEAARFGFRGVGGRSNTTAVMLPGLEGQRSGAGLDPGRQPHPRTADCRGSRVGRWPRGDRARDRVDEENWREAWPR